MAHSYHSLKSIFHQSSHGQSSVDEAHALRLQSPSTIRWDYQVRGKDLFVVVTTRLHSLCEQVWRREVIISRLWSLLPKAATRHYIFQLLIEEIQSSNEIEGVHSTKKEIAEALSKADSTSTKRFEEMSTLYSSLTGLDGSEVSFPTQLEDIRALYDSLLKGEIDAENGIDGELFRNGVVHIFGGSTQFTSEAHNEQDIRTRLQQFLACQASTSNGLINALAGHFMFEHTHPFYDGNGRLGRFLMGLKLREILSVPTAMSLSRELSKDRQKYYKSFTVTEEPLNRGEATFFVIALLEMLSSAQESLLNSLERKKFALEKLEGRIQELRNGPGTSKEDRRLNILFIMGQAALFGPLLGLDLDTLATYLDKSKQTVRADTKRLIKEGLLEERSHKPLSFVLTEEAREFLDIE